VPERVQRKRTAGWRKPPGAVIVDRSSKWGNPYWHVEQFHGLSRSLALYANTALGIWDPGLVADWPDGYVRQVYESHTRWLERIGGHPVETAMRELAGRDLVCWCALGNACHADILLAIANGWEIPHVLAA
jgi:hypothetical protein